MTNVFEFSDEQAFRISGLSRVPNAIFTKLFVSQIRSGINTGTIDVRSIADQLIAVQKGTPLTTKPVRKFKGIILRNFFYVHWFETRFMPKNIANHWQMGRKGRSRIDELARYVLEKRKPQTDRENWAAAGEIAETIMDGFAEREKSGELTGEWIVFAKEDGKSIFITLASHAEPDENIYLRMSKSCRIELPHLFTEGEIQRCEELIKQRFIENRAVSSPIE